MALTEVRGRFWWIETIFCAKIEDLLIDRVFHDGIDGLIWEIGLEVVPAFSHIVASKEQGMVLVVLQDGIYAFRFVLGSK